MHFMMLFLLWDLLVALQEMHHVEITLISRKRRNLFVVHSGTGGHVDWDIPLLVFRGEQAQAASLFLQICNNSNNKYKVFRHSLQCVQDEGCGLFSLLNQAPAWLLIASTIQIAAQRLKVKLDYELYCKYKYENVMSGLRLWLGIFFVYSKVWLFLFCQLWIQNV